jgi:hypothetical protein
LEYRLRDSGASVLVTDTGGSKKNCRPQAEAASTGDRLGSCQMLERVKDRRKVQPINSFEKQST